MSGTPAQQDPDIIEFDDFEDDGPDDTEAIAQYQRDLEEYVAATGTVVLEPGQRNEEL